MDKKYNEIIKKIVEREQNAIKNIYHFCSNLSENYSYNRNSYAVEKDHVVQLNLRGVSISSLLGDINQFSKLRVLNLYFNNLKSIPKFQMMENLTELGLGANSITKIANLSAFPNLRKLELGNNKIETIECLEELKMLGSLNLSFNKIRIIENLQSLEKLEVLNLSGNQISEITQLDHLTKLKELLLSKNVIRRIEGLQNLRNLVLLDLEDNFIEVIENLENCVKLNEMYLARNPLLPEYDNSPLNSAQYWVNRCQIREDKILSIIPIISFIGYSNSGKTASIEALISYLSSTGYKVIALKHIHIENFSMDKPGKNTWRYSQAGAKVVVAQSSQESGVIFNWSLKPLHLIKIIYQTGLDENAWDHNDKIIALLEGFRDVSGIKILCVRNLEEFEEQRQSGFNAVSGALFENQYDINLIKQDYDVEILNLRDYPELIDPFLDLNP